MTQIAVLFALLTLLGTCFAGCPNPAFANDNPFTQPYCIRLGDPCLGAHGPFAGSLNVGAFALDGPLTVGSTTLSALSGSITVPVPGLKGFFGQQGLCLNVWLVPGSIQQFQWLADGSYDIIVTAVDNVSWRYWNGTGAHKGDLVVLGATDKGIGLDFVGLSNFSSPAVWSEWQNVPIVVDAANSGFVLALEYMAATQNVFFDQNPNFPQYQTVGGAFARWLALGAGSATFTDTIHPCGGANQPACTRTENVYGSMLSNPFTIKTFGGKTKILAKFSDYLSPFQNGGLAARRSWTRVPANGELLTRFIAGYVRGQRYVVDQSNKAAFIATLNVSQTFFNTAGATASYNEITDCKSGQNEDCMPSRLSMRNVIDVRLQTLPSSLVGVNADTFVIPAPDNFFDPTFCWRAVARLDNQRHDNDHDDDHDGDDDDHGGDNDNREDNNGHNRR